MAIWLTLVTIVLPWAGAVCVWWVGDRHPHAQHGLATGFSVLTGLSALALLPFTSAEVVLSIPMGTAFGDFTLVPDGLGVFLAVVAAVIGCLAVLFSNDYMHGEAQLGRYYALVLLFIGAMIGLALSGSLLLMFIFWEITAFCSYALISFHNDDPKAVAGGIKALIVTQLGGVGLLAGALVAYAYFGNYQIDAFLSGASSLPGNVLSLIAFGFLIAATAKSAQVPLHTWLPDAMEAPTPVSALIHAATMVNAGVYLLARFYPAFEAVPGWRLSVVTVGALSGLLAALMALVCTDLKRTLAYSTISQLGYMVFAIGCGGIFASQFHLMSHSVFKALLFLGAGAVIHATGTRDMRQMGGLGKDMPFVRATFLTGALALAGLPLANGFFSKEMVLESGLAEGPAWAYLIMLLGAGLTALYTVRMVWMVFYGETHRAVHTHEAPAAMRISLGLLAFSTLTSWLLAGQFSHLLADSLPFHSIHPEGTAAIVMEIIATPATWIAMVVIAAGLAIWFMRDRLVGLEQTFQPLTSFIDRGMGFEVLNREIVTLTRRSASALGMTQTGLLNWNVVGILGGLILTLILLAWTG